MPVATSSCGQAPFPSDLGCTSGHPPPLRLPSRSSPHGGVPPRRRIAGLARVSALLHPRWTRLGSYATGGRHTCSRARGALCGSNCFGFPHQPPGRRSHRQPSPKEARQRPRTPAAGRVVHRTPGPRGRPPATPLLTSEGAIRPGREPADVTTAPAAHTLSSRAARRRGDSGTPTMVLANPGPLSSRRHPRPMHRTPGFRLPLPPGAPTGDARATLALPRRPGGPPMFSAAGPRSRPAIPPRRGTPPDAVGVPLTARNATLTAGPAHHAIPCRPARCVSPAGAALPFRGVHPRWCASEPRVRADGEGQPFPAGDRPPPCRPRTRTRSRQGWPTVASGNGCPTPDIPRTRGPYDSRVRPQRRISAHSAHGGWARDVAAGRTPRPRCFRPFPSPTRDAPAPTRLRKKRQRVSVPPCRGWFVALPVLAPTRPGDQPHGGSLSPALVARRAQGCRQATDPQGRITDVRSRARGASRFQRYAARWPVSTSRDTGSSTPRASGRPRPVPRLPQRLRGPSPLPVGPQGTRVTGRTGACRLGHGHCTRPRRTLPALGGAP